MYISVSFRLVFGKYNENVHGCGWVGDMRVCLCVYNNNIAGVGAGGGGIPFFGKRGDWILYRIISYVVRHWTSVQSGSVPGGSTNHIV